MYRSVIASVLLLALLLGSAPSAEAKGFKETATASALKAAYTGSDPVRILIVPGHEPGYGGAVFKGVYEREIVVEVAQKLAEELRKDSKFEVIVARDNEKWNSTFSKYFKKEAKKIKSFVSKQKKEMKKLVKQKKVKAMGEADQVDHATAPSDVALRLYGINKWVNENDVDLVVNLHVNDATDHGPNEKGANSGFAIYVPDSQYGNGKASRPVAEAVAARLDDLSNRSTLRIENQGVVEDQELIAVGAYNSLKAPTLLIEYGYITEDRFMRPELRDILSSDYAHQTALGLYDFFGKTTSAKYATKTLPYTWSYSPVVGSAGRDVYALQAALRVLGHYPPSESSLVECPIDGIMDECTMVAIKAYQKSKGLEETGTLGPKTLQYLNARFGK